MVFSASAKSSTGVSLNDMLQLGPSLYPLLPTIITRFRMNIVSVSADISKMFHEIGLQLGDRDIHRFLLATEGGAVIDHRMKRLTFGVTSSPFLATKVLQQVAKDYQAEFPRAAKTIKESFYVDDCLVGTDTVEEAVSLRAELNQLLQKGRMTLRKWRSSSEEVLDSIPPELREKDNIPLTVTATGHHKALGLHWDTGRDCLHVVTQSCQHQSIQPCVTFIQIWLKCMT